MTRNPTGRPLRTAALLAYPLLLIGLVLADLVAPSRTGALALAQVFAPYLFAPLLLLVPFALGRGAFTLRLALLVCGAAFAICYRPALNVAAPPPPPAAPELRVMSWNVYAGEADLSVIREAILVHNPDVVALQEAEWRPIAEDPTLAERYPYRVIHPDESAPGMAILSRLPITDHGVPAMPDGVWDMPRVVWARLEVGGRPLLLVNAHPIPPRTFGTGCHLLRCYNAGPRDAQIAQVRELVGALGRGGEPLLLVGDLNVTEREPAYRDLARGLRDAHLAVGLGAGATWRPSSLGLPFGLIRIDYMLAAGPVEPLAFQTECAWVESDHCAIVGRFAVS